METVKKIVMVLHNYLRSKKCDDRLFEFLEPPEPEIGAFTNIRNEPKRAVQIAFQIRDKFIDFFNN